jgi:lysophospholipase L1-like esterase
MRWRRFVAIGDSFTEGLDDPSPDAGGYRGWADLVARALAGQVPPGAADGPFQYANLAVRGRLFDAIVTEQVPAALAMQPDLVSFAGGGNDVLRRRFDPDHLIARFDSVIGEFRRTGADVLVFRFASMARRLPGWQVIAPRTRILNQAVGTVARHHGAILVDLNDDTAFVNPALWSDDRLHLSTAGHRRVAAHVLAALGVTPQPSWLAPLPATAAHGWLMARAHDLRWAGRHLAPWLRRRLAGRSSGDTVSAKRPRLAALQLDT